LKRSYLVKKLFWKKSLLISLVLTATGGVKAEDLRNLLPNGSFEVGIGQWIGFDSGMRDGKKDPKKYDEMTLVKKDLIATTQSKIGRQSFCFNYPGFIRSKEIKLDPTKKYTISLYAKSKHGRGQLSFSMSSSYRPRAGSGGSGHGVRLSSKGINVKVGDQWQRHHVAAKLPESRNGYYKIWIGHPEADVVWIDGVQIEQGSTLSDYAPASRAEIGITSGREDKSNLFYTTEKVPVRTKVCVYDAPIADATVHYALWDYRNFKVKQFDRSVKLDAKGYGTDSFFSRTELAGADESHRDGEGRWPGPGARGAGLRIRASAAATIASR
jgi:hypothetical protein